MKKHPTRIDKKNAVPVYVPGDAYWIGTNLFRLRKRAGLTESALAKIGGISLRALRGIESADGAEIRIGTLSKLAAGVGVPTGVLFRKRKSKTLEV